MWRLCDDYIQVPPTPPPSSPALCLADTLVQYTPLRPRCRLPIKGKLIVLYEHAARLEMAIMDLNCDWRTISCLLTPAKGLPPFPIICPCTPNPQSVKVRKAPRPKPPLSFIVLSSPACTARLHVFRDKLYMYFAGPHSPFVGSRSVPDWSWNCWHCNIT